MATVETTKADGLACSECGHERSQHFEMRWPEDPNHCLVEGCDCDYFCWQKKEVAPDPGLREAAAKRMYDETAGYLEKTSMTGGSIPWEDSYERDLYRNRVDIVLSVLAERGVP